VIVTICTAETCGKTAITFQKCTETIMQGISSAILRSKLKQTLPRTNKVAAAQKNASAVWQ
jgi:hypothetical protein